MSWIVPFQNDPAAPGIRELNRYLDALHEQSPSRALAMAVGARDGDDDLESDPDGPERGAHANLLTLRDDTIQTQHSKLVRMALLRAALYRLLAERTISVDLDTRVRESKVSDVVLKLDRGITSDLFQGWFTLPDTGNERFQLLSRATKMDCPSFSIPAGTPADGGSCPAAALQTIRPNVGPGEVPLAGKRGIEGRIRAETGEETFDVVRSVCESCYAETNRYAQMLVQLSQVVRYVWARQALEDRENGGPFSNYFVRTMVYAIESAKFERQDQRLFGRKFFRIHDSGDFFSVPYLAAWFEIARHFNEEILFWAPTRIWAMPRGGRRIPTWDDAVRAAPPNLIIRPSAYSVDNPGPVLRPLGEGWAGATTVYQRNRKVGEHGPPDAATPTGLAFQWDCRAYAARGDKHSCLQAERPRFDAAGNPVLDARGAAVPSGETGCRACWVAPEMTVNYTLHA